VIINSRISTVLRSQREVAGSGDEASGIGLSSGLVPLDEAPADGKFANTCWHKAGRNKPQRRYQFVPERISDVRDDDHPLEVKAMELFRQGASSNFRG